LFLRENSEKKKVKTAKDRKLHPERMSAEKWGLVLYSCRYCSCSERINSTKVLFSYFLPDNADDEKGKREVGMWWCNSSFFFTICVLGQEDINFNNSDLTSEGLPVLISIPRPMISTKLLSLIDFCLEPDILHRFIFLCFIFCSLLPKAECSSSDG
jgi:hypothetical protein